MLRPPNCGCQGIAVQELYHQSKLPERRNENIKYFVSSSDSVKVRELYFLLKLFYVLFSHTFLTRKWQQQNFVNFAEMFTENFTGYYYYNKTNKTFLRVSQAPQISQWPLKAEHLSRILFSHWMFLDWTVMLVFRY